MTSLARLPRGVVAILLIGIVLFPAQPRAATGTIMPSPFQTVLDTNGNPVSGAKVCTYLAGTTTPTATYTDSALLVANSNPIVADSAGRFTAFLSPGASYKFIYQDATGTAGTCNGVVIKTVDNVSAVPSASGAQDDTGTAGEALTAGQAVYLSDGSGGKTQGSWYKADSTNTYSSTTPGVGMTIAAIAAGSSGTIRQSGQVTGLSSLTIGADYYVSTAGLITSTAPTNARLLGRADTTSSLVLYGNPPKYGPGSAASLTAHGVVIGNGTSAVTVTAAGTVGQLLTGVSAAADPTFQTASAVGASMVLLKANSGTDTAAGATNVDTISITGLTAKDMLLIKVRAISVTQATANFQLYNSTDSVQLYNMVNPIAAGATWVATLDMGQSQASATSINTLSTGFLTGSTASTAATVAAVTQLWTGTWTLALRHGGVTAGGTLQWAWSVYKLSGQ